MSDVIRLGVLGAGGRAGMEVLRAIPDFPGITLCAALEAEGSTKLGEVAYPGASGEIEYTHDIVEAVGRCDAFIDFSRPDASLALVEQAALSCRPVLVATTGHSDKQIEMIRRAGDKIPVLLAPNASLGVFVTGELVALATKLLGSHCEVEILDVHHRDKVDAPSGTALALANRIRGELSGDVEIVRDRGVQPRRSSSEIGIASLRAGEVVGEHTISFHTKGERIEIVHRALDRSIFARGALYLVERLVRCSPGCYAPADLLKHD